MASKDLKQSISISLPPAIIDDTDLLKGVTARSEYLREIIITEITKRKIQYMGQRA